MNLAQRIVLLLGFLLLLVIVLFPPWTYIYRFPNLPEAERPAGYHLIFGQHAPQDRTALAQLFATDYKYTQLVFFNLRIDQSRLTFEVVGIVSLTAILYLLLRSPRRPLCETERPTL